jgi:uncharacterized membrane protein YcaP (DUF421 family)
MDSVVRGITIYFILLAALRLSGRRTVAQMTTFDFVLLLIISEAVQQAMIGEDNSITNAFLLVVTLIGLNVLFSEIKLRWKAAEGVLDGAPLLIVENGKAKEDLMRKERVDVNDVLDAAREHHGLERLDQVKFAVLERNGKISIVPTESRS